MKFKNSFFTLSVFSSVMILASSENQKPLKNEQVFSDIFPTEILLRIVNYMSNPYNFLGVLFVSANETSHKKILNDAKDKFLENFCSEKVEEYIVLKNYVEQSKLSSFDWNGLYRALYYDEYPNDEFKQKIQAMTKMAYENLHTVENIGKYLMLANNDALNDNNEFLAKLNCIRFINSTKNDLSHKMIYKQNNMYSIKCYDSENDLFTI